MCVTSFIAFRYSSMNNVTLFLVGWKDQLTSQACKNIGTVIVRNIHGNNHIQALHMAVYVTICYVKAPDWSKVRMPFHGRGH